MFGLVSESSCTYSANPDIYTYSTIYILHIYTSESLDTAPGGKDAGSYN